MAEFLTRRAGFWHFARRVPTPFAKVDRRGVVRHSTKVRIADDPRGVRAGKIAERMNGELEAYWRGLVDGKAAEAKERYDAARVRARAMGLEYITASQLAERPVDEIVARVKSLIKTGNVERDEVSVTAALGGESPPGILLSELFDTFEAAMRASIADLSADQVRKWRNPKTRAIASLTAVIGDKPLTRVTRGDALDYQTALQERVLRGEVEIATANKMIGQLNRMFRVVDRRHQLGLAPAFSEMRIEGGTTESRSAFTVAFVQDVILKPGALERLNDQARDVVYLIAETGLRIAEAVNLQAGTIRIDTDVPHVMVRPDGRRMKTEQSARDIPLVGVALAAMRRNPAGFPRYLNRAEALSALVNKFFGAHGMRPTSAHSLYSLRHTFEDRLTAIEAPEKVIAALMGHKYQRPKYGSGPSLEQKRRWLQRIALKAL